MGFSNFSKIDESNADEPVNIYAELNRKQFDLVQRGDASIEVPYGVQLHNKTGSRALFFSCSNEETAETLQDGLDESSIAWQRQ